MGLGGRRWVSIWDFLLHIRWLWVNHLMSLDFGSTPIVSVPGKLLSATLGSSKVGFKSVL